MSTAVSLDLKIKLELEAHCSGRRAELGAKINHGIFQVVVRRSVLRRMAPLHCSLTGSLPWKTLFILFQTL